MRKARDPIPYLLHPFQETSRSSSAVSVTSKTETEIFPQGSTSNGGKVGSPKEDPTPGDDFTCRVTYLHLDENNHNWQENENGRDDNQENTIYGWIYKQSGSPTDMWFREPDKGQKAHNKDDKDNYIEYVDEDEDEDEDEDRELENKRVAGGDEATAEGEERENRNLHVQLCSQFGETKDTWGKVKLIRMKFT